MEYLSRSLNNLQGNKEFRFHPKCGKLNITNLSFADDLLMFGRGDIMSVTVLNDCFNQFFLASGLKANLEKSCAYFGGVMQRDRKDIMKHIGYTSGELPFKYLGVPLSTKKLAVMQWQPLIEKIVKKISSWTTKKLSYAGRLQLVQTVLIRVQAYWSQLFLMPSKVVKVIEAYCRSYVWSGAKHITKKALVSWEKVYTPKSIGGMNITNLHLWNQAAIVKTFWGLAHKQDNMWIKWIHNFYIKNQPIQLMPIPKQVCWMTRKILEARRLWENSNLNQAHQKTITRQMYLKLIGEGVRVPWKCLMFNTAARSKDVFTMWLQMQAKLLTKDRLIKWGNKVDPKCVMCQIEDETRDHLFVTCQFTRKLWEGLTKWMQMQNSSSVNWQQQLQWVTKSAKGKNLKAQIFRMVYAKTVYAIWSERNQRIFEQKVTGTERIIRDIAYICNVRAPPKTMVLIQFGGYSACYFVFIS